MARSLPTSSVQLDNRSEFPRLSDPDQVSFEEEIFRRTPSLRIGLSDYLGVVARAMLEVFESPEALYARMRYLYVVRLFRPVLL